MAKNPLITLIQAQERQQGGALLLDVRSAEEHQEWHPAGSVSVPVERLAEEIGRLGNRNQPVLLFCSSGGRSQMAAQVLRRLGYNNLYIVRK
ncbi:MAG: rhodanese-like domain-containing protein [Peptococcaceae bacterium]|jgi:rhodanese-related sulfurtransferase|nr:rhodanese-like domain-containing protein [Peptococcaceae bacterium]